MLSPRRLCCCRSRCSCSLALPSLAQAGVQPSYDLTTPAGSPFPSDRWTRDRLDAAHRRPRRPAEARLRGAAVRLRRHRRAEHARRLQRPAADLDPLHGRDRPDQRLELHVFLIRLPDRAITGINQIVWEPAANTLHVESDQLLRPAHALPPRRHERACATRPVEPIDAGVVPELTLPARTLPQASVRGAPRRAAAVADVAVASRLHDAERHRRCSSRCGTRSRPRSPAAADFRLGTGGVRTVFPLVEHQRRSCSRGRRPRRRAFSVSPTGTPFLSLYPGTVGTVAFGSFDSPDYETPSKVIPPSARRSGRPPSRGRTGSTSTSSSPPGPRLQAAGRSRSSGTASATTRTRARSSSPRRWHGAASRRSRSTSSVTAAARSGR